MKPNKVLLVHPGELNCLTKRIPLAILYLAESLIEKGFEPVILDMQVKEFSEPIIQDIICVGISSLSGKQIQDGLELAARIRKLKPKLPIVWGGIHASIIPGQTIEHELVDFVIRGEGERAFPELVKALRDESDYQGIENLVFQHNGKTIINPTRAFINFNKRNNLPYDLLDLDKYQTSTRFEYQSSRGCPHGCLFCYNKEFNNFKWRYKDAEIVLDELEYIQKRFNPQYLFFVDDEFFISTKRAKEIMEGMITRKFSFQYKACIRISILKRLEPEYLKLIDESGCFEMPVGAESGSQRVLDLIKKGISPKDTLMAVEKTKDMKVIPQLSFMSGFPTETVEEFYQTIELIDKIWKINPRIKINGLFFASPFPGTELFDLSVDHGYSTPSTLDEWGKLNFILSLDKLKYIPREIVTKLPVYGTIIWFKYLWMHAETFLNNKSNRRVKKYRFFILFRILFRPFYWLFKLRWKFKFTRFSIDIWLVKALLSKKAST